MSNTKFARTPRTRRTVNQELPPFKAVPLARGNRWWCPDLVYCHLQSPTRNFPDQELLSFHRQTEHDGAPGPAKGGEN